MTRIVAALTAAALLAGVPAAAQDIPPALDPGSMIGHAGTIAAGQYARQSYSRPINRTPVPPAARIASTVAQLSYRPSEAVRKTVYGRAVAEMQKSDAGEAAKLRTLLYNGSVRREVSGYLGRYGMSPNNVADTTALYLAMSWFAARANSGDPTPAQMRGLRAQVAAAMASTPGMARAADATKQEIAEAAIIQASFASALANAAARDPKLAAMTRDSVRRGVMSVYRMDITQVQLTNQGLR